ncbi:hypothetical protein [Streptosporangium sp. NPDC087985]|uniref:hypothetical protein n=1 Tax=Streptosporangium sp. NPDC087985 TaxID=3366196 RepID=UPI003827FC71
MSDHTSSRVFRFAFSAIIATAGLAAVSATGITAASASDVQHASDLTPSPSPTVLPNGDPWGKE